METDQKEISKDSDLNDFANLLKFWESPYEFINADSYNKENYTITK